MMQTTVSELQSRGSVVERQPSAPGAEDAENRSGERFAEALRQQETDVRRESRPRGSFASENGSRPFAAGEGAREPTQQVIDTTAEDGKGFPGVATEVAAVLPELPALSDSSGLYSSGHPDADQPLVVEASPGLEEMVETPVAQIMGQELLRGAGVMVADSQLQATDTRRESLLTSVTTTGESGLESGPANVKQLLAMTTKVVAESAGSAQSGLPGEFLAQRVATAESPGSHFANQLASATSLSGSPREVTQPIAQSGGVPLAVETPVADGRWGAAVAQRVSMAIQQGIQQAQIQLNPAHLGSIDVQIQLHEEGAAVTMLSAHAPVRDLLEGATQRLRELLDQQGIALQQHDVSDHPDSRQPGREPATAGRQFAADSQINSAADADLEPAVGVVTRAIPGLIDRYV